MLHGKRKMENEKISIIVSTTCDHGVGVCNCDVRVYETNQHRFNSNIRKYIMLRFSTTRRSEEREKS